MAPDQFLFMVRWLMVAVLLGLAQACFAQFPLPIPTLPKSFPLTRPAVANGTVVGWKLAGSYLGSDLGLYSVPAGLSGVVQLAGRGGHVLALKSDGTVVAWGNNNSGQTNVPAGLGNVVQVATGSRHSLALKSDGTVVAWGSNDSGQTNVPAGLSYVVQVAAANSYSLALRNDGTVVAWGIGSSVDDNPFTPQRLGWERSGVVQVAAGFGHSVALKSDGRVKVWGTSDAYISGFNVFRPDFNNKDFVQDFVQVAAADSRSLALRSNGTVVGWGSYANLGWGYYGNLGWGLRGVVQVVANGSGDSLALFDSGKVEAWYHNNNGEIVYYDAPGLFDAVQVAVIGSYVFALRGNDTDGDGVHDSAELHYYQTDPKKADTDSDGLPDGWEVANGTKPRASDATEDPDSDGLTNAQEQQQGTLPNTADTDSDGLGDGAEVNTLQTDPKKEDTDGDGLDDGYEVDRLQTDPKRADTDGDGLSDYAETFPSNSIFPGPTDPKKADTDGDGLGDGYEVNMLETDPRKVDTDGDGSSDAIEDPDGDGLTNTQEQQRGTLPNKADTDGDGLGDGAEVNRHKTDPKKADTDADGLSDGWEIHNELNPKDSSDAEWDTDGDGLTNRGEYDFMTDLRRSDTDGDGLKDGAEVNLHGTDPREGDTDGDGLSDGEEVNTHKTDPNKADFDDDGLSDGAEVNTHKTDPKAEDTDNDGLGDEAEVSTHFTDPKKGDTDGDGLSDGAEISVIGTDPRKADTDGDGLKDGVEINTHGTDPKKSDTDDDGIPDGSEIHNELNPKDSSDAEWDTDGDGLTNRGEYDFMTDLRRSDTDGDGLKDGAEVNLHGTDPREGDTDGDGLSDGEEVNTHKTDPKKADTDGDGLSDGAEVNTHKTDPKAEDTDGDGYSDGFEVLNLKSNPLRPNDTLSFVTVGDPKNPDEDGAGQDVENAGIGYVGEVFEIATTEVTNLMYARFLNAVAKSDTLYGLYAASMGLDEEGGIIRNGSSGKYIYTVKPGFENRPVNFVSLYDALRYINWLHNGMPNKNVQDSSTTENGAYKLLGANPRNVIRNAGAKFFLPDEDEWHKAAFFDPDPGEGRPSDTYWKFATQSDSGPGEEESATIGWVATIGVGGPAPSHYGTYDQGGNVQEWTETLRSESLQGSTEPARSGDRLIATGSRPMSPAETTRERADLGFRVGRTLEIAPGNALVTPALVRVGQEFNLGDDTNQRRGAVVYQFNMGTYEVSNAEYAVFLNAVARTDTFFGLYNTRMGTDRQGGIMRSGQNGNFSYTVKPGFANKPVNFVTVYSAMRFCNWLHNGARRDSETERGAYRLLGNIPPDTVTVRRSPAARFFLPTEDEYYKAAFYDPTPLGMPTASYWSFAVRSDVPTAQQINFGGAYTGLTDVDKPGGKSYFGTFGQSGNVAEWTEATSSGRAERLVYGGHYESSAQGVSAFGAMEMPPLTQSATVGFRIAASQGWQTILPFASIRTKTVASAPFAVVAPRTTSGLPVKLSVKSGPAKISGKTVTITGPGTVVLAANQAGNEDYDPAPEVTTSFVVQRTQVIKFKPATTVSFVLNKKFTLTASATSKLKVAFRSSNTKILRIRGNIATIKGKGSVNITASQAGNGKWSAAAPVKVRINIK